MSKRLCQSPKRDGRYRQRCHQVGDGRDGRGGHSLTHHGAAKRLAVVGESVAHLLVRTKDADHFVRARGLLNRVRHGAERQKAGAAGCTNA